MDQAIRRYWRQIAAARPWVVAAVVAALVLALYFAGQGYRYYEASEDRSSARDEVRRLERATRSQPGGTTEQEAQLVAKLIRLENLHQLFDYPDTDTLLAIVSETARNAGLDLRSMSVSDGKIEPLGTLQYYVQPVSISVNGPADNVQEFLATLHDRVPVVAASNASMANLESDPVTQIQLRFFLSPEPTPEEGG